MLGIGTESDTFIAVKFYQCVQVHDTIDLSVFFTLSSSLLFLYSFFTLL